MFYDRGYPHSPFRFAQIPECILRILQRADSRSVGWARPRVAGQPVEGGRFRRGHSRRAPFQDRLLSPSGHLDTDAGGRPFDARAQQDDATRGYSDDQAKPYFPYSQTIRRRAAIIPKPSNVDCHSPAVGHRDGRTVADGYSIAKYWRELWYASRHFSTNRSPRFPTAGFESGDARLCARERGVGAGGLQR